MIGGGEIIVWGWIALGAPGRREGNREVSVDKRPLCWPCDFGEVCDEGGDIDRSVILLYWFDEVEDIEEPLRELCAVD